MKIGLRAGHSPNCWGAVGIVNEHQQMKTFYEHIKTILERFGHTVVDCNSNASTENVELREGVRKANDNNVDLFISLHMNAYDGTGNGVEALTLCESSRANPYAIRLCENFSQLGFRNRGLKFAKDYEMRYVNAPNIIFEICFCDSAKDIEIYNRCSWDRLTYTFCNAIDTNITKDNSTVLTQTVKTISDVKKGRVIARSGLNVRNNQNISQVIGCLESGTIVTIDKQYSTNEFWSIRFGNKGGFVSKKYIEIL